MDKIVKGCDWTCDLTVGPTSDETNADVTTQLTGATVTASIKRYGTAQSPAPTAVVQDASARTIRVTYTAANTASLSVAIDYLLDVRVTTTGGKVYQVEIGERVRVVNE